MKISAFQNALQQLSELAFYLPDGNRIPVHFHITEAGLNTRHFVDCGGTERIEKTVNFQIWVADDLDHRLSPQKLLGIIGKAESLWKGEDPELELEYQSETIGRYGLDLQEGRLLLRNLMTDCLAKDKCGVPDTKRKVNLKDLTPLVASCMPGSGCC
jgi:hypothetical protein